VRALCVALSFGGLAACGRTGLRLFDDTNGESTDRYEIELVSTAAFNKVDLLFVIDNSISMADKQRIFADAVPVLLKRLISPLCIDAEGDPTGEFSPCPSGAAEFRAIEDIHVGVVTSSLGNHGGDVCTPDSSDPTVRMFNDRAELLPSVRPGLYSYGGYGFLVWDPRTQRPFPDPHPGLGTHETEESAFINDFASQVRTAGERGCGYESSLEAWYRFLVDPEPITEMTYDAGVVARGPVNQVVLEQRRRFLRPDSLVAVVVLSDENDCSIVDENAEQGFVVGRRIPMPRASSECAVPGADAFRCCRPCGTELEGCPPSASDVECRKGLLLGPEDSTNLRCFEQKRRFGFDLLYPIERYVEGLTRATIAPRGIDSASGTEVVNPLFALGDDGTVPPEGRAFLVGIVGVPWQDIADPASLVGRELRYLDVDEFPFAGPNRWDVLLGDPQSGVRPGDPFMVESIEPRAGQNPLTGDVIEPPHVGRWNAINGHEQDAQNRDDLQYACTFDLSPGIPCTEQNQDGCDCNAAEFVYDRSLCQYANPLLDGTQVRGKAYPALRQLQVLKGLGHNAVVASVCPKNMTAIGNDPAADPSYGYNPAVGAMVSRLKPYFAPRCLPKPLPVNEDGRVPCSVVEGQRPGSACFCDAGRGRLDLGPELSDGVRHELAMRGFCGGSGEACADFCLCEVRQFELDELAICQSSPSDDETRFGFCYLDRNIANPELLGTCPVHEPQNLRFMGAPAAETPWFQLIACAPQER
jgi:hypothetical protein